SEYGPSTLKMMLCAILLLLLLPAPLCNTARPSCKLQSLNTKGYIRDGDIVIGGIFPIHYNKIFPETFFTEAPEAIYCEIFNFRPYRWLQAMVFAIEEINQNPKLLPNISLGFQIYDSCTAVGRAVEGTMWLVMGHKEPIPNYRCQLNSPLAAVIGGAGSCMSIPIASILGLYHYPQISYFSTVPLLSNKKQFPSFFWTIPSDEFQSLGLARLVTHFGWTWVGILAEDNDYGLLGAQSIMEELHKTGTCIAFHETIPINYSKEKINNIVEVIKKSSANAIVIFCFEYNLNILMEEISRQNITNKVWIASEAWCTSPNLLKKEFLKTLTGTIGFAIVHPSTSPNHLFVKEFWEVAFDCKWTNHILETKVKLCTGTEKLGNLTFTYTDVSGLRVTYNVYNAVYAVAHALHDLYSCYFGEGPFENGTCASIQDFEPRQLLHYLKNMHFRNNAGEEVYFDVNGNPPALYDILNWQLVSDGSIKHVKIGSFDSSAPPGQELSINENAIMWNGGHTAHPRSVCSESCPPGYRKAARPGQPICCFDCIRCSEGEVANYTDSSKCLMCPDDHWSNLERDKCIPKTVEFLSYEDPMGVALTAIAIISSLLPAAIPCVFIKYRDTPVVKANNRELSYLLLLALVLCFLCSVLLIGHPTVVTCMFRQIAFGIIFTLSVSCVLAKTIMVVIAFNATKPNSNLKKWLPNTVALVCTLIQVIICTTWLCSSPPFPVQNMKSQIGTIIIECNDGSTTTFWYVLGYMGLLAIVSFIVAFLARNLPDSFNEAKFITFSMLVFVSVWLAFIPAYLSTQGKYMVAVEIFAILASSAGLLGCIFFPKRYIILLQPHMNTKEYLMGKANKFFF
uniref:G-protein coupled receptors family 3 profile domain-containing protein n=1 Tax=Latimeria chalumnae TaxID=7897 RepID=H3A9Z5_LATCH